MSGAGTAARVAALGRFEAARMVRSRWTALGVLVFLVAHALGRWQHAGSDGLFTAGYVVAFALSFGPGLSADRDLAFDLLLVFNFLSPGDYALGKSAGMLAWAAAFTVVCWAIAAALGGGDVRFATWHAALAALLVVAALPFVVVADLLLSTRLPTAAVLVVLVVCLFTLLALGVEASTLSSALGFQVTPYSYRSLLPLLLRAGVGLALTPALIVVGILARYRPPAGGLG